MYLCVTEITKATPSQANTNFSMPPQFKTQAADSATSTPDCWWLLTFFFFPQKSQSIVWTQLWCQPSCATSPLLLAWPAEDLMLQPHAGATNQPSCPLAVYHSSDVAHLLFPLSVFECYSLQGSKPDTRCDECSVVLPTADVHFTVLISCNQISFVMNKSKATIIIYFHLYLIHHTFFCKSLYRNQIIANVHQTLTQP